MLSSLLILFLPILTWAQSPSSSCGIKPEKPLTEICEKTKEQAAVDRIKHEEGDFTTCAYVRGIWNSNGTQLRVSSLPEVPTPKSGSPHIQQALIVENIGESGSKTHGYLFETSAGWKFVPIAESCRKSSTNVRLDPAAFAIPKVAHRHNFATQLQDAANGLTDGKGTNSCLKPATAVQFDDKKTTWSMDGKNFKLNAVAGVKDYIHNQKPSLGDMVDGPQVRVPPELYSVFSNPDYKKDLENKKYASAIDRIYKKALEVSDGDKKAALLISLMMVDVRKRGPCGAVYGLKKNLIPPSIMDGERFGELTDNRRDAAPHFFSYALTAQDGAPMIGDLSSFYTRLNKSGSVGNVYGPMHFMRSNRQYWGEGRPRYDLDADEMYNDMGLQYGLKLFTDQKALPSDTINSSEFEKRKFKVGLGTSRQPEWEAHDPYLQTPPNIPVRDRAKKVKQMPLWPDDETQGEDRIKAFDEICNSFAIHQTNFEEYKFRVSGCKARNKLLYQKLKALRDRNFIPLKEMIQREWIDP